MALVKRHICEREEYKQRQLMCDHYVHIEIRQYVAGQVELYCWKPAEDVGFVISFCPFCGTPADMIIRKAFPKLVSMTVHLMIKDEPLPDRACFKCEGTEFRALVNTSILGYKQLELCMKCNHIFLCTAPQ